MKEDTKTIRQALIGTWKSLGIRRLWLAKQSGIDRSRLSRWENGHLASLTGEEMARLTELTDSVIEERANAGSLGTPPAKGASDGKALSTVRRAYGISQLELSERAGVTRTMISLFENGYSEWDSKSARRIKKATDALVAEKVKKWPELGRGVPLKALGRPESWPASIGGTGSTEADSQIANLKIASNVKDELIAAQDRHIAALHTLVNEMIGEMESLSTEVEEELAAQEKQIAEYRDLLGLKLRLP
jgi:transcriptional regulator with XRE-family HTH domain